MSRSMMDLENRDNFRPYHAGMSNREPSMASIILLSKPSASEGSQVAGYDNYQQNAKQTSLYTSFRKAVGLNSSAQIAGGKFETSLDRNMPFIESNTVVPILDFSRYMTSSGLGTYYGVFNNFSLTSVSEAREELVRINMNFGGNWNAFFFGENPRVFQFQGVLLDSPEYPYYQEFVAAYDMYLSGRKSIANNFEVILTYDGRIVSGYLLKLVDEITADQYNLKSFAFTVLVKSDNWFRNNTGTRVGFDGSQVINYMNNEDRYKEYFPNFQPSMDLAQTKSSDPAFYDALAKREAEDFASAAPGRSNPPIDPPANKTASTAGEIGQPTGSPSRDAAIKNARGNEHAIRGSGDSAYSAYSSGKTPIKPIVPARVAQTGRSGSGGRRT